MMSSRAHVVTTRIQSCFLLMHGWWSEGDIPGYRG